MSVDGGDKQQSSITRIAATTTDKQVNVSNLQQILSISTSMTNEEDKADVRPVGEERQKFFFEAVQNIGCMEVGSFQVDIEIVKQSLQVLKTLPNDVDRCCVAMQNMIDLVDHIDVATDFIKLSGVSTVGQFLRSKHNQLVRLSAEIIGIAAQNHPHCQKAVIDNGEIFENLLAILHSSEYQDKVKIKALFAVSSIIQNNKAAHEEFLSLKGYDLLVSILMTAGIPLRLRTCFVVDCLCCQFPQIKCILVEKQYVRWLIDLLSKIPLDESKETVLGAMLSFVEGCDDAIEECKKEEYNLRATLDYLISCYKDDVTEEKSKAIKLKEELDRFSDSSRTLVDTI